MCVCALCGGLYMRKGGKIDMKNENGNEKLS